jgi:16S rRNA (uracil1498-N3)-methyltransferase
MKIEATNFYVEPSDVIGDRLMLSESESRHIVKVMRAKIGEIFWAIDGRGNKYQAQIIESNPRKVVAKILEHTWLENEAKCKIALACGLCRASKMDYIVEKGTELGVAEFRFFVSEKTYTNGIGESKLERWNNLAQSAAKQSMRTVIPQINQIVKFDEILSVQSEYKLALMAEIGAESNLEFEISYSQPDSAILLVGPESGFSADELEQAHNAGFKPCGLGPRRLRAETAAMVFVSIVMAQLGEL